MAHFTQVTLCFAMLAVVYASHRNLANVVEPANLESAPWCGVALKNSFENGSWLLKSNPARLLLSPKTIYLRELSGEKCTYMRTANKRNAFLYIDKFIEPFTACCSEAERYGFGIDGNGNLLSFAARSLDSIDRFHLSGAQYRRIKPDQCPKGGCPLVVEVAGRGGKPWLMMRQACAGCRSRLGVVMISPTIGPEEDTGLRWVSLKFIPFVRAYIAKHTSLVNKARVYLVSASRGNEIALTAALASPDIWSYVLMTGKFRFTPDAQDLMRTPHIFEKSRSAGLTKLEFNIGELDPIVPDEEFYANMSALMDQVAQSALRSTQVSLHVYPGYAHDTSPGVWSRRSGRIWGGSAAP